ncbi:uncharacterized protein BDW47DRAFT_100368 [Aspergillus candidus]|uniref:Uncharacterized protein n=1 Tax=Aspergillus candidus TaxID=41067 RepID=A0A2I2FK73_ASPCN|nr:hypothetical protein BDW47DRAFT_100368 [Aspergillus candidus]PLB41020.1 hypothetical protein BDW47DRAFT_100368 [Aspergillus candidus]
MKTAQSKQRQSVAPFETTQIIPSSPCWYCHISYTMPSFITSSQIVSGLVCYFFFFVFVFVFVLVLSFSWLFFSIFFFLFFW